MKLEYRVRWRREGAGRANTRIYQSEPPGKRLALILEGRLAEAFPDTDPDAFACCSGRECGCRGETNAEVWKERHDQFPPLTEGPHIESREVGEWEPDARERGLGVRPSNGKPPAGLRMRRSSDVELARALGEWMDRNLDMDMPAMSSEGFYRLATKAVSEMLYPSQDTGGG